MFFCKICIVFLIVGFKHGEALFNYQCSGDEPAFMSIEKELLDCLLSNYDPLVRPVLRDNDTVTVKMNIATVKVADIDEKNQLLKLKGWIYQEWHDPQLTWQPSSYGGITELRIPMNRLWSPDIVLYNYAELESPIDQSYSKAIVKSDGRVIYYPSSMGMKTGCRLDLSKFPYDTQTCYLVFGPWSNNIDRMNITVANSTMDVWYEGHEWKVLDHRLRRVEHEFSQDKLEGYGDTYGKFAMALYSITVKRNPVYYQHIFVTPAVLLMMATLFIYLVPPEAGERLSLCGLLILGNTLLLLMLENHLPTEVAEAPLLLRFILYSLLMNILALVITTMSLNFYHRDIRKGKVPNWMRKIFLGKLSKYLCMKGSVYNSLPTHDESMFDGNAAEVNTSSPRDIQVDRELKENTELPKSTTMAIDKTMDEVRRYLRILAAKSTLPEPVLTHRQIVVNEWHQVALVVDRLAFVFFTALTLFVGIIMALV